MKLELLDAYNIRARLSASIILLAPFAVTFFCTRRPDELYLNSTVLVGWLR